LRDGRKYGNMVPVKTTIEIPDPLFRRVKSRAAERGQSLREFVAEALQEKLSPNPSEAVAGDPPWMQGFGKLRRLHRERAQVEARIDEVFEVVESEDRA
jgi:hypothetical protein